MQEHMTIHTMRANWQQVNSSIHGIVRHFDTAIVEFVDIHPFNKTLAVAADTVLVKTAGIDMETAMLICTRIPASFQVWLFNDQLPNPDEPIRVERPAAGETGLDWEAQMDEAEQRRLSPDLPTPDNC